MKREIYTYFDASLGQQGQGEIFYYWYRGWKRRGWEPRLLHPRSSLGHPKRKEMVKALNETYPDDPVARAQGMALLTLQNLGKPVFYSEYDVINFGLASDDPALNFDPSSAILVNAFGWAGKFGIDALVYGTLYGKVRTCPDRGTWEYGCEGWEHQPIVHFSRAACEGVAKHIVVQNCGRHI